MLSGFSMKQRAVFPGACTQESGEGHGVSEQIVPWRTVERMGERRVRRVRRVREFILGVGSGDGGGVWWGCGGGVGL